MEALRLLKPQCAPKAHRGVALITAVLVAALVTATAVTMATTHRFSMQRGFNQLNSMLMAHSVKNLETDISAVLIEDKRNNAVDSSDDQWAREEWAGDDLNMPTRARVTDLQAMFNLQNLAAQFGPRALRNRSAMANPATSAVSSDSTSDSAPEETLGEILEGQVQDSATSTDSPLQASNSDSELEQDQIEAFDFQQHRDFIDSYVSSCVGENQQCTREAIALVLQRSRSENEDTNLNFGNDDVDNSSEFDSSSAQSIASVEGGEFQQPPRTANGPASGIASEIKAGGDSTDAIDSEAQLSALFRALDLDLEPVQAILDWIDQDSETRYPNGAEDEYYTGLEMPYRAGNGPFTTVRELLLVRGITTEIYEKLSPHISILPQATPININTASADVLMAIHPMIDRTTAELLIDSRNAQQFQTVKAFIEHPALLGLSIPSGLLSVNSEHFLIESTANSGGLQTHHQTVVRRTNSKTNVLRRAQGYFN